MPELRLCLQDIETLVPGPWEGPEVLWPQGDLQASPALWLQPISKRHGSCWDHVQLWGATQGSPIWGFEDQLWEDDA